MTNLSVGIGLLVGVMTFFGTVILLQLFELNRQLSGLRHLIAKMEASQHSMHSNLYNIEVNTRP